MTRDVHFDQTATPEQIGHKAVARALSDIAAMGGTPAWIWVNIASPQDQPSSDLLVLMESASRTANAHNAMILGGDTSTAPTLSVHVFGIGTVPNGSAVLRSGASDGDVLFVTGELGGSIKGRHLAFSPRVKEGEWLREAGATSMIDLSDGLFTDIRHVMEESKCGATLTPATIPISDSATQMDGDALAHACQDGEDYELLFTAAPEQADQIEALWDTRFSTPLSRIGYISSDHDVLRFQNEAGGLTTIENNAYEHFS